MRISNGIKSKPIGITPTATVAEETSGITPTATLAKGVRGVTPTAPNPWYYANCYLIMETTHAPYFKLLAG